MSEDSDVEAPSAITVAYVVGGCALLALGGIAIPAGFQAVQPADEFFDVQEVDVVNVAGEDTCGIELTTTYWSDERRFYAVETTLYEVDEDSTGRSVQTWTERAALPSGVTSVEFDRHVEEPLDFGVYYFEFVVTFETEYGWEKRAITQSERFSVHHGTNESEPPHPMADDAFVVPSTQRCV